MKAAVLEVYHKPLQIRDVEIGEPAPHEVTIEVKACGLCSTDVHISEGKIPTVKLPLIPGHEFAGVVVKIGERELRVFPSATGWWFAWMLLAAGVIFASGERRTAARI